MRGMSPARWICFSVLQLNLHNKTVNKPTRIPFIATFNSSLQHYRSPSDGTSISTNFLSSLFPEWIYKYNHFLSLCAWITWMHLFPADWRKTILLSFPYFHWLLPLSATQTFSRNRSIYSSIRERIESKDFYWRLRFHLMGSWILSFFSRLIKTKARK